ncbi:MAG: hypothetical protein WDO74_17905 [Pseudomonadota bacterium]
MTKLIKSATRADVDLLNAIEPPVKGVHVGGGIHVEIPDDWAERIANGEDVPGCSYAELQDDGSLLVSETVQAELMKPGKEALAARLVDVIIAEPVLLADEVKGEP